MGVAGEKPVDVHCRLCQCRFLCLRIGSVVFYYRSRGHWPNGQPRGDWIVGSELSITCEHGHITQFYSDGRSRCFTAEYEARPSE